MSVPEEIWNLIFSNLKPWEKILPSLVSSHWHRIIGAISCNDALEQCLISTGSHKLFDTLFKLRCKCSEMTLASILYYRRDWEKFIYFSE